MGKVNKNNLKTKLLDSKSPKQKLNSKEKSKDASADVVTKDKSKLLLNKTITPKKTTSKKEKHREKRKNLMNKFTLIRKQQKEEKARKNREKTAVIGDLKPLKDALPSLDDIFKLSKEKDQLKTGLKEFEASGEEKHLSAKQKIKKKKEKFMKQVKSYQSILKDPEFKKNPREAIRFHIQYTHGLVEE
ncbi:ribosome biogenesis protein SLX9 homolog [Calliphora vicina]|uniref:ribosome biogenesis protein SLX9 homolog n=1 Tax=Calliphora vicina TaxID=7373 RepID=UPI00325B0463